MKEIRKAKRYFLLHPHEVCEVSFAGIFTIALEVATYFMFRHKPDGYAAFPLFLLPFMIVLAVGCFQIALRRIRIDETGITLYGFLQKKRTILWGELNCHGYFVHATNYKRFRRFFYFSRVPLRGGVNFLGLGAMPPPTDDLLYVAEQRDVEEVIEYYVQQHKGKKKRR